MTRIFVLMGQGGRLTSLGIVRLYQRLQEHGEATLHSWNDPDVVQGINASGDKKVAVVGYSLGANQLGYISQHAKHAVNLGIAYDPSRLSPLVHDGWQQAPNFKKVICYQNVGAWVFGGSGYSGTNVETIRVNEFHLGIQFWQTLHDKTLAAVAAL